MTEKYITYRIPQLECQVQVPRETLAVLEPFLALGLDLGTSFGRGRVCLQRKVVQVGADGDSQTAIIIVNKR